MPYLFIFVMDYVLRRIIPDVQKVVEIQPRPSNRNPPIYVTELDHAYDTALHSGSVAETRYVARGRQVGSRCWVAYEQKQDTDMRVGDSDDNHLCPCYRRFRKACSLTTQVDIDKILQNQTLPSNPDRCSEVNVIRELKEPW